MRMLLLALALCAFGCRDSIPPSPPQQAAAEIGAAPPSPVPVAQLPDHKAETDGTLLFQGAGAGPGMSDPRCQGPVFVRVRNASTVDFDSASIDDLQFGPLHAGELSPYQPVESGRCIYRYGAMSITSGKQRFLVFPIDFVGETPLPPGYYTQALTPEPPDGVAYKSSKDPTPGR